MVKKISRRGNYKTQSKINKKITGQPQASQLNKKQTVNQNQPTQQTTPTVPPSIERPGPEGEADEEEPSEVTYLEYTRPGSTLHDVNLNTSRMAHLKNNILIFILD